MNLPDYIDFRIQVALAKQELQFIDRENNAIMADGSALAVEKNELDPASVRYQAIELALEQVDRRTEALRKWGTEVEERVSKLSKEEPEPPASA